MVTTGGEVPQFVWARARVARTASLMTVSMVLDIIIWEESVGEGCTSWTRDDDDDDDFDES